MDLIVENDKIDSDDIETSIELLIDVNNDILESDEDDKEIIDEAKYRIQRLSILLDTIDNMPESDLELVLIELMRDFDLEFWLDFTEYIENDDIENMSEDEFEKQSDELLNNINTPNEILKNDYEDYIDNNLDLQYDSELSLDEKTLLDEAYNRAKVKKNRAINNLTRAKIGKRAYQVNFKLKYVIKGGKIVKRKKPLTRAKLKQISRKHKRAMKRIKRRVMRKGKISKSILKNRFKPLINRIKKIKKSKGLK